MPPPSAPSNASHVDRVPSSNFTILALFAIGAVTASALGAYYIQTALNQPSSSCGPRCLNMTFVFLPDGTSTSPDGTTFYENFTIEYTMGEVMASYVGFSINATGGVIVNPAAAVCRGPSSTGVSPCTAAASGWYLVLLNYGTNYTWRNSYPSSATSDSWTQSSPIPSQAWLVLVSPVSLTHTGDSLHVHGRSGATAEGTVRL